MEQWEIAKRLLCDEDFVFAYSLYHKAINLNRRLKNYSKVDMSLISKEELRNMLSKVNLCHSFFERAYNFDDYFTYQKSKLKNYKQLIETQINKRTYKNQNTRSTNEISKKSRRRAYAKANHGQSKCKNR